MSGFKIKHEAAKAKQEDIGTVVEIFGLDDLPVVYDGPDEEDLPVTITVCGAHSSIFRRVEAALRRRKLKPRQLTGEAIFEDNLEKVVACTQAWDGFEDDDGKEVAFTRELVKDLYLECPWVYEQVLEAMHDHARFFGGGSTKPTTP